MHRITFSYPSRRALLSSSSPRLFSKQTSRDTRLAGRQRFYKQVGVTSVGAPWLDSSATSSSIESPISAGVDGTQSASGVHHPTSSASNKQSTNNLQSMLLPRQISLVNDGNGETEDTFQSLDWFGVTLDGRTLKTPMGQTLAVPSRNLAFAVAAEWDSAKKFLQPAQMPLMTLVCTALDQVAHHPQGYQEASLNYLATDTTCFWADPTDDRVLHRRQEQAWKDLLEFCESKFGVAPRVALGASEALLMSRKRPQKEHAGLPHPSELYDKARQYVLSLDAWQLVALHAISSQAKSFLVALAMLEDECPISVIQAMEASRVEEEFQISNWGLVEGGHDYDRLNCSVQLHAAQVLLQTIALEASSAPAEEQSHEYGTSTGS